MQWDIFVSYASVDYERVAVLVDELHKQNLNTWFDRDRLDSFEAIVPSLKAAISNSAMFLVCLSEHYLERPACQWELIEAFSLHASTSRRVLVVEFDLVDTGNWSTILRSHKTIRLTSGDKTANDSFSCAAEEMRLHYSLLGATAELEDEPQSGATWPSPPLGSAFFVGRLPELVQIHSALLSGHSRLRTADSGPVRPCIISGFAGVGKTLLAQEYARRFVRSYPGGFVQISLAGAGASYSEFVFALSIQLREVLGYLRYVFREPHAISSPVAKPSDNDVRPPADITDQVQMIRVQLGHVMSRSPGPLLWIVDDLPTGLTALQLGLVLSPNSGIGYTLMTTRTGDYYELGNTLELACLNFNDAERLLQHYCEFETPGDVLSARGIAEALGEHPLSLAIVGTRLKSRSVTYPELLQRLQGATLPILERYSSGYLHQLPSGHAGSISTALEDTILECSDLIIKCLALAGLVGPRDRTPLWLAAIVIANVDADSVDDLTPSQELIDLEEALHEASQALLASVRSNTFTCHALIGEAAMVILTRRGLNELEFLSQAIPNLMAWLRTSPAVLSNVYSAHAAEHGFRTARCCLTLSERLFLYWDSVGPAVRNELIDLRSNICDYLEEIGYEFLAVEASKATATSLLQAASMDESTHRFMHLVKRDLNLRYEHYVEDQSLCSRLSSRIADLASRLFGEDDPAFVRALEEQRSEVANKSSGQYSSLSRRIALALRRRAEAEASTYDASYFNTLARIQLEFASQEDFDESHRAIQLMHIGAAEFLQREGDVPDEYFQAALAVYPRLLQNDPPLAESLIDEVIGLARLSIMSPNSTSLPIGEERNRRERLGLLLGLINRPEEAEAEWRRVVASHREQIVVKICNGADGSQLSSDVFQHAVFLAHCQEHGLAQRYLRAAVVLAAKLHPVVRQAKERLKGGEIAAEISYITELELTGEIRQASERLRKLVDHILGFTYGNDVTAEITDLRDLLIAIDRRDIFIEGIPSETWLRHRSDILRRLKGRAIDISRTIPSPMDDNEFTLLLHWLAAVLGMQVGLPGLAADIYNSLASHISTTQGPDSALSFLVSDSQAEMLDRAGRTVEAADLRHQLAARCEVIASHHDLRLGVGSSYASHWRRRRLEYMSYTKPLSSDAMKELIESLRSDALSALTDPASTHLVEQQYQQDLHRYIS
jgi:hypothetical protein